MFGLRGGAQCARLSATFFHFFHLITFFHIFHLGVWMRAVQIVDEVESSLPWCCLVERGCVNSTRWVVRCPLLVLCIVECLTFLTTKSNNI